MFVQVPSKSISAVDIFLCRGLKLTNSDCPPFGALASLSCCSSGSWIFFLANRIIIQHQFFLYSSLPGKELQSSEIMYSRAELWRLQHSQHWYFLHCFSTLKVSLCFNYSYFSCWALFSGRCGLYSCLSHTHISLPDLPWFS